MKHASGGFTLLEILVALVVLGFLFAALLQGLRFERLAYDNTAIRSAQPGELEMVDRTLRRLVAHMDPGQPIQPSPLRADTHTLAFRTDLPAAAGVAASQSADVSLGVDAAHCLVLRWHSRLSLDPSDIGQEILAAGVADVDFAYWQPKPGVWIKRWVNAETLPSLVRMDIRFTATSRPHWPALVMATMRDRVR